MPHRIGEYLRQNVLGLVAIFLALSAGAYAVQKAPKNSVVSKSIKDGQVKNVDLAAAAVDQSKLTFVPGDVDSVAAGSGLAGGGTAGDVSLSLAPCATGEFLLSTGAGYACGDAVKAVTTSSDTPSVAGGVTLVVLNYTLNMSLNDLTGGVDGQVVTLLSTNNNPLVIDNNSPFRLNGNWSTSADDTLTLVRSQGGWYEVARTFN